MLMLEIRRYNGFVAVLLGLLTVGCTKTALPEGVNSGIAADNTTAPIKTDRRVYPAPGPEIPPEPSVPLIAAYTNRTGRTAYLGPCGGIPPRFSLEKRVNGRWERGYGFPCALAVPNASFPVAPGETRVDTLMLYRRYFAHEALAGTYRVVYTIYESWDPDGTPPGTGLLPVEDRVSNEFRIEP